MPASPNDAPVTDVAPRAAPGSDGDPGRELAFRRSLRASRVRRASAALRRRRVLRSRRSLLGAVAGLVVLSGGAFADSGGTSAGGAAPSATPPGAASVSGTSSSATSTGALSKQTIKAAQRKLGVKADGALGPRTRKAIRRFQRRKKLKVDGRLWPQTLKALRVVVRPRPVRAVDPGEAATLARIAQCESGGDPTAISADQRYRGKYQFSHETWRSVGGKGDPAAAPEAEQDLRAATLLRRSGTTPWPNCG